MAKAAAARETKTFEGYVQKSLAADEDIVFRAHFNWTFSFWPVFWFALGAAPIAMYLMLEARGYEDLRAGWLFSLTGFSIGTIILLFHVIYLITTEIVVTNFRFVYKTGWISRKTQEVSLGNIEEIALHQTIWGRLLGFGKLIIRGTGVGVIELPNIDDPLTVRRKIESARTDFRRK